MPKSRPGESLTKTRHAQTLTKQELSCCRDGRVMLHNWNSEIYGGQFLRNIKRTARDRSHESYDAEN